MQKLNINLKKLLLIYLRIQIQNIQYLDSEIKNINLYRNYLIVTTKNKLYIFKNHDIIKGFPVDSDGYFNISDINYNEKPDLVNVNEGVINNIELLN